MTTSDLMAKREGLAVDGLRLRRAREDDWDALRECYSRAFGGVRTADFDSWRRQFRLTDIAVAEDVSDPDAPFVVGTAAVLRTTVTVPGGAQLRVAACAQGMVSVTHQKRGLYSKLQAELMYIALETGADVFAAMPGPGGNYGGVGVAGHTRHLRIDRSRAKLRAGEQDPTPVREARPRAARAAMRAVFERWQRTTPGALDRGEFFWPSTFGEDSCVLTHPDGYAVFDLAGSTVLVRDFCALTVGAHRELLRCLLGHGEYTDIVLDTAVDDPTPLLLQDTRTAAVTGVDTGVWMWILNLPDAMRRRSYRADFRGVLEIADPYGMSGGRFSLDIVGGRALWGPAAEGTPADLCLGPGELASVYFGAHTAAELHRAGRIEEFSAGTVAALDLAFAPDRRPFNTTPF
ncbi:GNAT family N-acetyltransferase [Nocardia stercoris]|uniref:GNAT family N-acetyltransferase n=1 Tax=Nocardia stercoris TaxID=2483361 RepID=A0A3M2KRW2_9NOCA|nr:GNAT family N-acetyltransferase [Nocardia stercoris]RMI28382.1 GNAT family N-acetyltransferase [Nocardia stercoris]